MRSDLLRLDSILGLASLRHIASILGSPTPRGMISAERFSELIHEADRTLSEYECLNIAGGGFDLLSFPPLIASIASDYISKKDGMIYVSEGRAISWKQATQRHGEDLFTCAFLALGDRKYLKPQDVVLPHWPFCLRQDNPRLNAILSKGVSENHLHLNGSAASFYLNWVALHNMNVFSEERAKEVERKFRNNYPSVDYREFERAAQTTILLRKHLFKAVRSLKKGEPLKEDKDEAAIVSYVSKLFGEKRARMMALPPEFFGCDPAPSLHPGPRFENDYAEELLPDHHSGSIEAGERAFLYWCYYFFEDLGDKSKLLFLLYLILKEYISLFFCLSSSESGFADFNRHEKMGDIFIKGTRYETLLPYYASAYLAETPNLLSTELRIAPPTEGTARATADKLRAKEEAIAKYEKDHGKSINHIFGYHFIKSPDKPPFDSKHPFLPSPRNQDCRERCMRQAKAIARVQSSEAGEGLKLRSIDAANRENRCRPEVFGLPYRYLKSQRVLKDGKRVPLNLGYTYHVGEDFIGIVDGLRSIEEAVEFLDLQKGDRLGHCLALGTDPAAYAKIKLYELTKTKQDALDDYVYAYDRLPKNALTPPLESALKKEIFTLMSYVYGRIYPIESYVRSMHLRGDNPYLYRHLSEPLDYGSLVRRLKVFRQSHWINLSHKGYEDCLRDPVAQKLYHLYHFKMDVRVKGDEPVTVKITPEIVGVVGLLQSRLLRLLKKAGLSVETNPTSNFLIGPFRYYENLPIFYLNSKGLGKPLERKDYVPISVDTDDQGVFRTSIETEYAIILELLTERNDPLDVIPDVAEEKAYAYIDYIRGLSNEVAFR
jgi:hypothetical protein